MANASSTVGSRLNNQLALLSPRTITVPDDYLTIQEAINAAIAGDTVFVRNGTYYEDVIVNKTVCLIGENRDNTIVCPNNTGPVFSVKSSNVKISGFTVSNSYYGISISRFSSNNTIIGCVISYNVEGIYLRDSWHNAILDNVIANCTNPYGSSAGILIVGGNDNRIENNSIVHNGYGVFLSNTWRNVVTKNNMLNIYINVYLWHTSATTVSINSLTGSSHSIFQHAGVNDTIFANNISYAYFGISVEDPWGASKIFHNNFIGNSHSADISPSDNATWDNGFPSRGNYWSDYSSQDLYHGPYQNETGSDGIGDTPYVIDDNNTDHYPLMKPYVYVRIGDLNNDGKVNMVDIALVASAFGSTPDGPRWNFDADINEDGIINLRDIAIVARNFLMPL
jgi:parallel beta-helix repeat protein